MAFGIEVKTSSGFLQIDDIYPRYRVLQAGSTLGAATFPVQALPTFFFARPGYGVWIVSTWSNFSSGEADGGNVFTNNIAIVPCDYAVFARSTELPVPTSGFGLNVLGPDSKLIFSSAERTINIDTVVNFTQLSSFELDVPTPKFGRRFLMIAGSTLSRVWDRSHLKSAYYSGFALTSETHISCQQLVYSAYSPSPPGFPGMWWSYNVNFPIMTNTLISGYMT